jgi:hypothetical protein
VEGWVDIQQVIVGTYYTLGLKSDGTVVAVGDNSAGQRNIHDWDLDLCSYTLSPTSVLFKSKGRRFGIISITDLGACGWTAESNDPWIKIIGEKSGFGVSVITKNHGQPFMINHGD